MKRILITLLAMLYMLSATGGTLHMHYCMSKLVSADLIEKEEHTCKRCGMKKETQKKGCCKDEHRSFKTSDHQLAKAMPDVAYGALHTLPSRVYYYPAYCAPSFAPCIDEEARAHAPPSRWRTCPIYITVRNFRL